MLTRIRHYKIENLVQQNQQMIIETILKSFDRAFVFGLKLHDSIKDVKLLMTNIDVKTKCKENK